MAALVFTDKGKPPRGYSNWDELSARLEAQPGAITYLPVNLLTDRMKVVHTFE